MSFDPRWHRMSTLSGVNLNSAGSDNAIVLPPGVTIYLRNVIAHGSAATAGATFFWDWLG